MSYLPPLPDHRVCGSKRWLCPPHSVLPWYLAHSLLATLPREHSPSFLALFPVAKPLDFRRGKVAVFVSLIIFILHVYEYLAWMYVWGVQCQWRSDPWSLQTVVSCHVGLRINLCLLEEQTCPQSLSHLSSPCESNYRIWVLSNIIHHLSWN